MKIDPKDLVPVQAKEFRPGGWFYLRTGDWEYKMGVIHPQQIKDPMDAFNARLWLTKKLEAGLIFVNRNRPWYAMNGYPPTWEQHEIVLK